MLLTGNTVDRCSTRRVNYWMVILKELILLVSCWWRGMIMIRLWLRKLKNFCCLCLPMNLKLGFRLESASKANGCGNERIIADVNIRTIYNLHSIIHLVLISIKIEKAPFDSNVDQNPQDKTIHLNPSFSTRQWILHWRRYNEETQLIDDANVFC